MLVAKIVEILSAPVEPSPHLLLEGIDLEIEHPGCASPLGEVAETKAGQKRMGRAHAFAKARAVVVLVGDQFLIADFRLARTVLQPRDRHVGRRTVIFWVCFFRQFLQNSIEIRHFFFIDFDRHRTSLTRCLCVKRTSDSTRGTV